MATLVSAPDRPPATRRVRGKWPAFVLAVIVNLLFVGVLVFSVSWQNRKPEAVTAELYAPPQPVVPPPQPRAEPKPQPAPEPPKPAPKPPEPVAEKPDTRAADIALKARQEAERRQQEQAERERRQREARQKELEEKRQAEAKREAEEKRQADLRERQVRQVQAMRAQAEREAQMRAQAERELSMRAQAEQEARARAQQAAAGAARSRAQLEWIDKIRSRIRGYINLPPDIPGNPEAIFDVVQLPTGEIIDVKLRKSSGVRAYDDAVQRAILKASPLPKPVPADLFQRNLELHFRPLDQ
jgi:colicin import membrane protein